jgi:hypothetical protein
MAAWCSVPKPPRATAPAPPAPSAARRLCKGALSAAAVLWRRHHPKGQQWLARVDKRQGTGQALPIVAPKVARAVSSRLQRDTGCKMEQGVTAESRVGEPGV